MKLYVAKRCLSLHPWIVSICKWRQLFQWLYCKVTVYECIEASLCFSNPPYYSNIASKLTLKLASAYTTISKIGLFWALFQSSFPSSPIVFSFLCLGFFRVHWHMFYFPANQSLFNCSLQTVQTILYTEWGRTLARKVVSDHDYHTG